MAFKFVCLIVFSAIFNNISVISWWSVLLVEETRGPGEKPTTWRLSTECTCKDKKIMVGISRMIML
jgi:hypothetical protein